MLEMPSIYLTFDTVAATSIGDINSETTMTPQIGSLLD